MGNWKSQARVPNSDLKKYGTEIHSLPTQSFGVLTPWYTLSLKIQKHQEKIFIFCKYETQDNVTHLVTSSDLLQSGSVNCNAHPPTEGPWQESPKIVGSYVGSSVGCCVGVVGC